MERGNAPSFLRRFTLNYLSLLVLLFVNTIFAFDDFDCGRYIRDPEERSEMSFSRLFSSTTSYTTSTGPCGGFGMKLKAQQFLVHNYESIQENLAQGKGEYLNALMAIYQCSEDFKPKGRLKIEPTLSHIKNLFSNCQFSKKI